MQARGHDAAPVMAMARAQAAPGDGCCAAVPEPVTMGLSRPTMEDLMSEFEDAAVAATKLLARLAAREAEIAVLRVAVVAISAELSDASVERVIAMLPLAHAGMEGEELGSMRAVADRYAELLREARPAID